MCSSNRSLALRPPRPPSLPPSLGPFPAVFASSRATCLTARSLYSIGRPASPAGGGRLIFARKPISSSEWNVKVASLRCSEQIPINVFACTYAYVCTLFEKCLRVFATLIDLLGYVHIRSLKTEDIRLKGISTSSLGKKKTQAATPSLGISVGTGYPSSPSSIVARYSHNLPAPYERTKVGSLTSTPRKITRSIKGKRKYTTSVCYQVAK